MTKSFVTRSALTIREAVAELLTHRMAKAAALDLREELLRRLAWSLTKLNQRRGVEARKTDLVSEAKQRLHSGDVGVESCGAARSSVRLGAHRFQRVLHVLHRGAFEVRASSGKSIDKAAADALVSPPGVV